MNMTKVTRIKYGLILTLLAAAFTVGVACDQDDDGDEEGDELAQVDCDAVEVPRFEDMSAIWNSCVGCHSSTLTGDARQGAPRDFDYDSHEAATLDPFETAEVVIEDEMPPSAPLSDEAKEQLSIWAQCGTP